MVPIKIKLLPLTFMIRFDLCTLSGQFEYELVLKPDLYTLRHTQWYYFRVTNAVPGVTYKLRIVNLLKRDSLYNHGNILSTTQSSTGV